MVQRVARLDTASADFESRLAALLDYDERVDDALSATVEQVLEDVRTRGDEALLEYTRRFDELTLTDPAGLCLAAERPEQALAEIDARQRDALQLAAERVRHYAERQRLESWHYREDSGTVLGQTVTALDRVGVYVPGGKASYPSSVLMNVIPARVAGVGEVIMVVPAPRGELSPLVLAAAAVAGVDRIFTIGGAQAIAALAYGTATVPAVDKIVGPGNAYVAAAKRRVFGRVGIDMIAGPSEILVIADGSVPPDWVAMDLFAQAEHDENAQAIALSPDAGYLERVATAIDELLDSLPRKRVIAASLAARGALIKVSDLEEAVAIANRVAPEHLELATAEPERLLPGLRHAGAVFAGCYSAEVLGDYCAGPNHVLPTAGSARFSSPLGVYDFQKRSSYIECSREGAGELADVAAVLAEGEGLDAHARSARLRSRKPGHG